MSDNDMIQRGEVRELLQQCGLMGNHPNDPLTTLFNEIPAAQVTVKPGEIERAVWSAMIWAADNNPGFNGVPEYTSGGNSFAETECRSAAARIRSALTVEEKLCEDEGCPHHRTPHICVNNKLNATHDPAKVQALVDAAEKLLDAYSAIVGPGNPWGDELRAALAAMKEGR